MADTIKLNELKPGDLLLYEADLSDFISRTIAKLTHSAVTHTAMSDYNPAYIIEEGNKFAARILIDPPGSRVIHIRRLKNSPDTSKVDDIAMKYVEAKLPYPDSNLVLLGLNIIVSDFFPDTILGDIIKNILRLITYELIKFFNKIKDPDSDVPPMVCSEFATFCYDEAAVTIGPEYKIHYNEKVNTVSSLIKKIIDQLLSEPEKTFKTSHLISCVPADTLSVSSADSSEELKMYCDQLVDHLSETQSENHPEIGSTNSISDNVIMAIYNFAKWFMKVFAGDDAADLSESVGSNAIITADEVRKLLEKFLRFQEAFVTPEDIYSNSTNLDDLGILTYTQKDIDALNKSE
ncbi:MAG: hypothetical protein K6F93_02350 [Lachnospiraceae bacterium]|nr:hypothetical protein [Lachnospiraceae bacterium]